MEEDGRDLESIGHLEEAHEGVLLEVGAGVGLDIGEALEVVLEGVELERGEAALGEPARLGLGLAISKGRLLEGAAKSVADGRWSTAGGR